ncbi:kinase-like domain, phloem protein 2-like protein, partial [Tanacetum coccineum]
PTADEVVIQLKKSLEFQEDYEKWEPKLPKDYKEILQMSKCPDDYSTIKKEDLYNIFSKGILLKQDKVQLSFDGNGERNKMVSATTFSYINCCPLKWQSLPESRFGTVVEMSDISNLNINIKTNAQFLSPDVVYGVYLYWRWCDSMLKALNFRAIRDGKLKNKRRHNGLSNSTATHYNSKSDSAQVLLCGNFQFTFPPGQKRKYTKLEDMLWLGKVKGKRRTSQLLQRQFIQIFCWGYPLLLNQEHSIHEEARVPNQREDGWMEIQLWKFNSAHEFKDDSLSINMKFTSLEGTMSGLIVCGLEFRPVLEVKVEILSTLEDAASESIPYYGDYLIQGDKKNYWNSWKLAFEIGQSWKKGRLPLSAENAGTSAAEDIDLDEDNGKYMMTGKEECEEENVKKNTKRTGGRNFVGDCRDATTKERNQQRFVDKKRDTEKGKGLDGSARSEPTEVANVKQLQSTLEEEEEHVNKALEIVATGIIIVYLHSFEDNLVTRLRNMGEPKVFADSLNRDMTAKFGKLGKFEGNDFRRSQKKMHFLLTTLKVMYMLSTLMPEFVEDETLEQTRKRYK